MPSKTDNFGAKAGLTGDTNRTNNPPNAVVRQFSVPGGTVRIGRNGQVSVKLTPTNYSTKKEGDRPQ